MVGRRHNRLDIIAAADAHGSERVWMTSGTSANTGAQVILRLPQDLGTFMLSGRFFSAELLWVH